MIPDIGLLLCFCQISLVPSILLFDFFFKDGYRLI